MIQRIQSLFLLLVVIISALLLYVPVYELQAVNAEEITVPSNNIVFLLPSNAFLMIINAGVGILAFFAIFMFKRRNLQVRMCNLALLLTCILIGLLFFSADMVSTSNNQRVNYLFGSYFPLIQLLFLFLSIRFIKKDEELVRSADRLR